MHSEADPNPNALELAFRAHSPRLDPRPATRAGFAFYTAIVAFWMLAMLAAFSASGLLAWTVGVAYIGYDTLLLTFVAWQSGSLWSRPAEPTPVSGPRKSVGVIVAAYDEAPALAATIDALLNQSDPPDRIWLADDGSSDESAAVLLRVYGLIPPELDAASEPSPVAPSLRWLRLVHRGKARALNAALGFADTDVVITVDADTILAPDAIAEVRRAFEEDDLVVGGGVLSPRSDGGKVGRALETFQTYEYVRNFLGRHAWSRLDSLLLISGAFAAFRREAVMTVGGFDPDCLVEDYELIHRLQRHAIDDGLSWRVRILGKARAVTDAPASLPAFLRQRRRWFAGFLQTQYWNRDMIGAPRFGALGLAMMPVKSLDTLQPIYGLAGSALLVTFLVRGEFGALLPATGLMLAKIGLDIVNIVYSIAAYRRWTGARGPSFAPAILCLVLEPFSFQILRHLGAAWGWLALLTGAVSWGRPSRSGRAAETQAPPAARSPARGRGLG